MITFMEYLEMVGTGAIVNSCKPKADFQIWGACSEKNSDKKNKSISKGNSDHRIKEVADQWYRENGSPKFRAMTQTKILQTMESYKIGLEEAAELFEKALLFYKNEHVIGGAEAYWDLVKRMKENPTRLRND